MKKVVRTKETEIVGLSNVQDSNIYAFKGCRSDIYKAHKIDNDTWAFIGLDDSKCWANGRHASLRNAIESNLNKNVYEFDNVTEFLKWALEV